MIRSSNLIRSSRTSSMKLLMIVAQSSICVKGTYPCLKQNGMLSVNRKIKSKFIYSWNYFSLVDEAAEVRYVVGGVFSCYCRIPLLLEDY